MSTPRKWTTIREYEDILFDYYNGIARITINRERYRNAFTPTTTAEMSDALRICREEADIDVIVITGAGDKAFCSGGDQNVKGRGGYIGKDGIPRLSVLDVQKQIRSIPKPVIAAVNGFAIGGGHVLHVVCDLSIASENAIFGQTGPRVGSFDAGFGASYLARVVGQKKAREIWFLCRKYTAQEALDMGLVNKVVPLEQLEDEYVQWAEEMMLLSPLALRMIKAGLNAETPTFDSTSDTIDGVSVNGRTVDITKNAEFTLFAVDSCNNVTEIPLVADNLGEAPQPHLQKVVSGDMQTVKVYLIPPEDSDFTNLVMTNDNAKQETSDGEYNGLYYIEVTDNENIVINYTYTYKGENESGELKATVTEIDNSPAFKISEVWS